MFVDARTVPYGSLVESDVAIIGAGAAGIAIARELRARPLRVVLLESGWFTPDAATQSLYAGEVSDRTYFTLDSARTRCFGGSTNQWAGECRPLDAQDFDQRDWVADSGWPFGLAHLLPFYHRAQSLCQLGPYAYTADDWRGHGVRLIAFLDDRVRSYALHYSPPTRFGEVYRLEIEQATNVVTYLGANIVDVETPTPPVRVSSVKVACVSGNRFRVKARVFVLAAGGIENARLLLMANRVQPTGLGNTYDLVGRYFMEHVYLDAAATIRDAKGSISEFYTAGHWSGGRRIRGMLGLDADLRRQEQLTNYCAVLDEESGRSVVAFFRALVRTLVRGRVPAGALGRLGDIMRHAGVVAARRSGIAMRKRSPRLYLVKNVMEQAPNPESRVVLGHDRDRLDCPRVVLRWRLSAIDKHTAHRAHQILREELSRVGVGRLRSALGRETDPWPAQIRGARHHMGTTRMHPDPRHGVVDANSRVHGIGNLYVAGSSVFPTSGAANPTLTIVALALRLADHLKELFD